MNLCLWVRSSISNRIIKVLIRLMTVTRHHFLYWLLILNLLINLAVRPRAQFLLDRISIINCEKSIVF